MAKKKSYVVGTNETLMARIPKKLDKTIIEFKMEYEKKHKTKISKQWAAIQLSLEIERWRLGK